MEPSKTNKSKLDFILRFLLLGLLSLSNNRCLQLTLAKDYYYTRTRENPQHLRVSEEFKNKYVNDIKFEREINGTKYEYYKSNLIMSHDELVFETIDKIFRHRLSPFYIHRYDKEEDRKRSFDPKIVSPDRCARDLMYLVERLSKRSTTRDPLTNNEEDQLTPELTAFFDSYARQEAGLLMGNTYWVGAYDQCVNRHIFELTSSQHPDLRRPTDEQQVISFKGRYCVSSLKSSTWDNIISSKKESAKTYFKSQRQIDNYSKLFRLQVGICLPDSCDSSSYERHAAEIKLLTTSMLEQRYSDYELIDLYCLPDESSELRSLTGSGLNFVIFIVLWSMLLFVATIADIFDFIDTNSPTPVKSSKSHRRFHNFVTWFSLRANYHKLMKVANAQDEHAKDPETRKQDAGRNENHIKRRPSTDYSNGKTIGDNKEKKVENRQSQSSGKQTSSAAECTQAGYLVNLRFLNAFKVMIMFWIVNGHIMLLMIQTAKNILYSDALLNGLMHFLIGATFGVDLFFTMTGFLTSYLIFNSGQAFKMKPATWLYLSFHRYWRLAPLYLLSFWFSRSVAQLLGTGPLWDYGTSSITFRGLCNSESWWYPLTLTSNLHGLFEECMITSWYISCDMQFWLLSPLFIWLLSKKPLHGWVACIATIVTSSKLRFDAILKDQSARYDELVQPRADIFMRVSHDLPALYTHPHYRIAAYLIGLLAGHFVYMVKTGRWASSITRGCPLEQQLDQVNSSGQSTVKTSTNTTANTSNQQSGGKKQAKKSKKSALMGQLPTGSGLRQSMAYVGLLLFVTMSFVSYILSHYFPSALLGYARTVAGIAYSLDHLVMSIGASLIIIAMCFGQWPSIVKFLSHPHWTRLSKMNYALLLLQCEAIYFQIFRYDQVPVAGTRELINILFNLLVTLYPVAFVVTLAFEYPLANVEKLLITTGKDGRCEGKGKS